MYRKLVPFDGAHFEAVDQIALRRTAQRMLELIPDLPLDDSYGIRACLVPTLKKALEGRISRSIVDEREIIGGLYIYESREEILPPYLTREFQTAYARFVTTVMSWPLDPPEVEWVDGQKCAWMDFEEEGDWPTKVKYP